MLWTAVVVVLVVGLSWFGQRFEVVTTAFVDD
jgi:hypothetical protein